MNCTRNYFYQISDDGKSVIIGTGWDKDGKVNQIGYIEKRDDSIMYLNCAFKCPNGILIEKERAGIDEFLDSISEYLTKEDLIGLSAFLYLWGK